MYVSQNETSTITLCGVKGFSMSLSAYELTQIIAELSPVLIRDRVQKVVQVGRDTVILGLRGTFVLLSAHPRFGRIHLTQKPAGSGEAAPAFCMLLRKELMNARVGALSSVPGERVAEIHFERVQAKRTLRLFIYGRAAQLQLLDEEGKILGAIGPARRAHVGLPAPREMIPTGRFGESPGVAMRAAAFYEGSVAAEVVEAEWMAARAKIHSELQRAIRLEEALQRDEARARADEPKRKWADLLLAHLQHVTRGALSVTVPDDFSTGEPINVPLLPALSPMENIARLYKDHRRAERALAAIGTRRKEVKRNIEFLEARIIELARSPSAEMPPAGTVSLPTRTRGRALRKPPYRTFKSRRGATILVGRGAEKNDELTFHVARGNDLWLHARDVPGAHVVVPLSPGRSVDEETLVDAALLAAYYSNAREESQADVTYTLRKHVRKARGKSGAVLTASVKTIRVRLDPERLKRLLHTITEER
jgi:predicted ribosome quality control (RQC) complex YloA/Tae2 family protein